MASWLRTVVLNADGSGTFKQGDKEAVELSEVIIEGITVSFKRALNLGGGAGGGDFTLTYGGEVESDTLTMEISFDGGGFGGGDGGGPEIPALVLTRQ